MKNTLGFQDSFSILWGDTKILINITRQQLKGIKKGKWERNKE